jgi:hypothetical protein
MCGLDLKRNSAEKKSASPNLKWGFLKKNKKKISIFFPLFLPVAGPHPRPQPLSFCV